MIEFLSRWPIGVCASVTAFTLCLQSMLLHAEEISGADSEAEPQESTTVVGRRDALFESITEVDLTAYTGFGKVIDREEFATAYSSFGELLDKLPGIQMRQTGGFGSLNTVSIRGSSGKQVNFFLDGMLLNSPGSGVTNIQYIPSVLIDRVEVYPDFTPAKLGNANLAGAVNFVSRRFKPDEQGGQVSAAYGSFNTSSIELSGWSNFNGWETVAAIESNESDNDYPVDRELFDTPFADQLSEKRLNDGFSMEDFFVKFGKRGEKFATSTLIQFVSADKELATHLNRYRDDAELENKSWRLQSTFDHYSETWKFGHRLSFTNDWYQFDDQNNNIGLNANLIESDQDALTWFSVAATDINAHHLELGVEVKQADLRQEDLLGIHRDTKGKRDSVIFSFGDNWQISNNLLVNSTLRYYQVKDSFQTDSTDDKPSGEVSRPTFHFGVRWHSTPNLILKTNLGSQLRLPYIYEKFGNQGIFEGNPDLKAEKARTIDAGFEYTLPTFTHLELLSSVYYKEVEQGIYILYNSQGIGGPENIGESAITGFESELHWTPVTWFSASINTTLLGTENKSDIKVAKGKQLAGVYHQNYGLNLSFIQPQYEFSLSYYLDKELYYNTANTVSADDKKDLGASFTMFFDRASFDVTARNILDTNFLDFNRMPTQGVSVISTLTFDF